MKRKRTAHGSPRVASLAYNPFVVCEENTSGGTCTQRLAPVKEEIVGNRTPEKSIECEPNGCLEHSEESALPPTCVRLGDDQDQISIPSFPRSALPYVYEDCVVIQQAQLYRMFRNAVHAVIHKAIKRKPIPLPVKCAVHLDPILHELVLGQSDTTQLNQHQIELLLGSQRKTFRLGSYAIVQQMEVKRVKEMTRFTFRYAVFNSIGRLQWPID